MKIRMLALKPQKYAGQRIEPGQEFDVRGSGDARLLRALKRAVDAPEKVEPIPASLPALLAPKKETEEVETADKPKRRYRRRDLTAEQE